MQSAGVHKWRIVGAVLKPTFVVMLLSLIIGEFVSPPLEEFANANKAVQLSGSTSINSEGGTWRKIGDDYIHINAIAPGGEQLIGVSRYRINERRELKSASFAESGEYVSTAAGGYWRMVNVSQSLFADRQVITSQYLQEDWQADLSPELLSVLLVEPDKQSLSGLYRFAQFFSSEGLDSGVYFLAFWKKLLQPLSTLALVVLAISFVFAAAEATMGFRVFVAIGTGLAFTLVQRMMEPVSLIYGVSPLMAVLTPVALCALGGVFLMRRVA